MIDLILIKNEVCGDFEKLKKILNDYDIKMPPAHIRRLLAALNGVEL